MLELLELLELSGGERRLAGRGRRRLVEVEPLAGWETSPAAPRLVAGGAERRGSWWRLWGKIF